MIVEAVYSDNFKNWPERHQELWEELDSESQHHAEQEWVDLFKLFLRQAYLHHAVSQRNWWEKWKLAYKKNKNELLLEFESDKDLNHLLQSMLN